MSNEHEALKPCPFCGADDAQLHDDGDPKYPFSVVNTHLYACFLTHSNVNRHRSYATDAEAITAWNTRATPSPSTDTLERREAIKAAVSRARREWDGSEDYSVEDAITDAILAISLPAREVSGERAREALRRIAEREPPEGLAYQAAAFHETQIIAKRALATTPAPREKLEEVAADAVHEELWKADDRIVKLEADLVEALAEYEEPMSLLDGHERGERLAEAVRATLDRLSGEG